MKWILLVLLFLSFSVKSQTLHAIMVSDVEDPKLGGVSLRDEETILQILKSAESGTGLELKTYYHNRASFTAKAVRETLSQMRVGAKDVVFFYYTGLGFYPDANSQFPTFKLKESFMQRLPVGKPPPSLDEVGDILQQRGVRLNVVMADCRNTTASFSDYPGPIPDEDVRNVFWKKLFLGSCGLVKIASAKEGQKVWGDGRPSGSMYIFLFNKAFEELLESGFDGIRQATWPQFLKKTETHPKTLDMDFFSFDPNDYKQTPLFEIKACTASQRRNNPIRFLSAFYDSGACFRGALCLWP